MFQCDKCGLKHISRIILFMVTLIGVMESVNI